ncbi:hypothetical protein MON38_20035 [Hymenobacter sp. DH14]|uniref:Uncharacterized protein n=1 Tax=Hymenobacter cyanobacteriorum TaxID=2926463 RepID=A0A9X1VIC0_9BACT|nr:hypothetical protein [Hymenobacter cyanobacteriorum]MCI1189719.1 hypothetical protein [Hymenobacter cyanobacteriorum]
MHPEEFDYLIRRAAQAVRPSSEAEIEVGWQQLLTASAKMNSGMSREWRALICVDLPGPHGRLSAVERPDTSSLTGMLTQ